MKKIYRIEVGGMIFEHLDTKSVFFKSEKDALRYIDEGDICNDIGLYDCNDYVCDPEEVDLQSTKNEMTIRQFEKLFGVNVDVLLDK